MGRPVDSAEVSGDDAFGPASSSSVSVDRTEDGARGVAPAAGAFALTVLLYTVQMAALAVVVVARHFGLVANEPLWAYGVAILGSSLLSKRLDRWTDAPRGSWRLHARVFVHAVTVMSVIYLTGWGPALGVCFVYAALVDLLQSGADTWRAVLGWSSCCCVAGQLLVFEGWMPTFLSRSASQALGFLGIFAFGIVIRMAGAIGEEKQRTQELLATSEAHHRAVVENAAEGIFAISPSGTTLSFNAAAEAIFGWTAAEIVGEPASRIVPSELHDALAAFLATVNEGGSSAAQRRGVEITGVRRDGSAFPMMISTSAIVVDGAPSVISCIVRDLSDQKDLEERLAYQALHDTLTGLPNRLMLMDRLEQALNRVRRHNRMAGVLYVDIDRFKTVNDTLGHAAGDRLLIEATTRIVGAVRETDTIARLGGDEFVVLCEDLDSVQLAAEIAERIIGVLREPFLWGDDEVQVSASVGIALSPTGIEHADALLVNADIAMYRAKGRGRDCYELFDEAMQEWVASQAALDAALRHALPRRELRLFYQAIVDADSGAIRGFEALLRWQRPGFGLVAPDEFIPTAENTGLIVDIGAWVLEQACESAAGWSRQWPQRHLGISVNISSRQLVNRDIIDVVKGALARTGLDPTMLTLEITESTLIDDTVNTRSILRELRELGLNLSLDDFGTGYSSLTYLRAFPINIVKIDKSFVRTIGTEREDTAIVAAVIALAKNLDFSVVAEGVESREQLAVLIQLGCPYLQGYLFSRPVPAGDVSDLVEAPSLVLAPSEDVVGDSTHARGRVAGTAI